MKETQRDTDWFDPWVQKFPGVENGNPLQYSCLVNSMDKGTWWATVHGITKSWTRLNDYAHERQSACYEFGVLMRERDQSTFS